MELSEEQLEWAFEDANPIKAEEIIGTLEEGLKKLKNDKQMFNFLLKFKVSQVRQ